jgi:hypothetical protein
MSRSNTPVAVQRGRCEESGQGNDLPPATLRSKLNFRSTIVLISEVFQLGHRSLHLVHWLQRQLLSVLLLLVIGSRRLRCHDNSPRFARTRKPNAKISYRLPVAPNDCVLSSLQKQFIFTYKVDWST